MRRLAMFACSFALAAAVYVWLLPQSLALPIAAIALIAAFVLGFFRMDACRRARLCAFGLAVGLLWCRGYERIKLEPLRALCGEEREITAELSDAPQETAYGCRVEASISGGTILLYLDCAPEELSLGDTVTLRAEVIDVSRGSGDDENLYYQSHDVSLLGFQHGDEVQIAHAESVPLRLLPKAASVALRGHIDRLFPDDTGGFVRALLTGDRSGLSYRTRNELSVTGIAHVVAVSGMHVSLLVGAVMLLCFNRRRLGALVSLPVMLAFAAMLGFTPSVTRAVIMNIVLLMAPILGREEDPATTLSLALLVILACNPWAIGNLSLQLSFGAVAGILLLTPRIARWLLRLLHGDALKKRFPCLYALVRTVVVIFSTTLGATLLIQPLLAKAFGVISLVGPLTNVLLLTLIGTVFTAAVGVLLLGVFYAPFASACAWVLSWPIRAVLFLVRELAKLPYAAVYTTSGYIVAWLVLVYILLGVYFLPKRGRSSPAVLLSCVAVTLLCACVLSAVEPGDTAVTAFDVGQGQCVFLRSGDFTALVDCGGDGGDADGENVARKLLMAGHREIDVLVLTHYDTDHVCGTAQLLSRIDVGELLLPELPDDTDNRDCLVRAAQEADVPYRFISADTALELDGGTLSLLMPPDTQAENASLSALLCAPECDILITGDLSQKQERALLQMHELPDLEVLVAGHHGAKTSTGEALLARTAPDVVLISVGENRYGHPSPQVLARVAAAGAQILRTDECGDITILR